MGTLFNKTTATGILTFASTEDPTNVHEERKLDEQYQHGGIYVNVDPGNANETDQVSTKSGARYNSVRSIDPTDI